MKILLAVDGSQHALEATQCLISLLARERDPAEVIVLNVQEPVQFIELAVGPTRRAIEEARTKAGRVALELACALLDKAGFAYRAEVEVGEIAATIDKYARDNGCGLIVIGPRGLGPFGDLMLGSVATKLIHMSRIPLLLGR